jgi:hypothetical protein
MLSHLYIKSSKIGLDIAFDLTVLKIQTSLNRILYNYIKGQNSFVSSRSVTDKMANYDGVLIRCQSTKIWHRPRMVEWAKSSFGTASAIIYNTEDWRKGPSNCDCQKVQSQIFGPFLAKSWQSHLLGSFRQSSDNSYLWIIAEFILLKFCNFIRNISSIIEKHPKIHGNEFIWFPVLLWFQSRSPTYLAILSVTGTASLSKLWKIADDWLFERSRGDLLLVPVRS